VNPETIVDETSITRSMVKGDNILHANCSASQTGGSSTDVNLFVEQVGSPLWTTLKEKFLERAIVTGGFSYSVLTPPGGDYKTVCAGEIKVFADLGWTVGESRGIVDNKISMMSTMTKDSSILEVNCRAPEGGGDGTGVGLFVPKKS
jgi:hypothetical protein